jgi:uncharacterized protein YqfA (UPF0365 family)
VNGNEMMLVVVAVMGVVFFVFLAIFFSFLRLWIQAKLTNTPVSFRDIVRMKLRRLPAQLIVHTAIMLGQRKIDVPVREIEDCYLQFGSDVTTAGGLAALVLEKRREAEV